MVTRVTQVAGTELAVCLLPDSNFRTANTSATEMKANAVRGDVITIGSTAVTGAIKGYDGSTLTAAKTTGNTYICVTGGAALTNQGWVHLGVATDIDHVLERDNWVDSLVASSGRLQTAAKIAFTDVNELQEVGEYGREYNIVTYSSLADRGTLKFKGTYNDGTFASPVGRNDNDLGQILIGIAANVDYNAAMRLTFADGSSDFVIGLVTSFRGQGGGLEATLFRNLSIELIRSPLES